MSARVPHGSVSQNACTLPILSYHKVDEIPRDARFSCNYVWPRQFAAQLRLLRRAGFVSISLADYCAHRDGLLALPARPIVITFDDGYRSNYSVAVPLLERYGFRATFFIVSDYLGRTNAWDDERQEPLLSSEQIIAMHQAGFEIQSHTRTHARLPTLSVDRAREELAGSRAALENLIQAPVKAIAYPWGAYDESTIQLARDAGYSAGVIVRRRTNFSDTPIFALRRIGINYETSYARFAWDLFRLRWRGA